MADSAPAASSPAAGQRQPRLKPEIYKTVDGKTIVEDELLHFLAVKVKTLSLDEIVLLAANTFDSDWIEASKKAVFELCPTTQRNIAHKGAQKDINNLKSCLKVLYECGENTPHFVSHYLEDLPPVTFTSLDVCALLRRMERLYADVSAMKGALQLQVDVCADLRAVTADVDRRVCSLEQVSQEAQFSGRLIPGPDLKIRGGCPTQDAPLAIGTSGVGAGAYVSGPVGIPLGIPPSPTQHLPVLTAKESNTDGMPASDKGSVLSGSPIWTDVIKKGKRPADH
ncbi:uncharacterized protein LOC112161417, partial [Oryzias melastigma]|uniref:uncharacterized protein LOC112161417 n=1 Tax=Oryzias melastigma TaxID=30732 RepID=UPI000CF7F78E